jgi:hypothetical protein
MVIVSDRLVPEFGAAVNATVPFPLPLAPDVMVIHVELVVAVHVHPVGAVTSTVPEPPAVGIEVPAALSVYVQLGSPDACVTVNDWPAIVITLERAAPIFGSTR